MSPPHVTPAVKSEREIFAAALECADHGECQRILDRECGGNEDLRRTVETLLAEHSDIGRFLENPAVENLSPAVGHSEDLIGHQMGAFTLIRKIGEGGGGSVYLAEQVTPVRRQVALKILKLGLDTESVIARFEAERQTLARMEHPHIARVIEAGATDQGRPYFVMEYVAGDPVTDYCHCRNLALKDRLTLFIQICRAIEHAHQKGVIHRDLKPSNILVREQEEQAMPKVIDFGVAKAIDPLNGDPHGFTINGTIIGTPSYMSPEQAARDEDIDTRADIYSLGVILYELLTGVTPLTATSPGITVTSELLKTLREVDPPRPSAYHRNDLEESAPRPLKGIGEDLDWITMKCLEKDRTRRFGSATELAQDLERFLIGAPITARPPSLSYRTKKFVGRNRGAMASIALLLLSLVAVAISSLIFGLRARKAEEREAKLRVVAELDRELALKSAEEARLHQYVANINLAQQAIEHGNLSKALLLLDSWSKPSPAESDPRGFEWWYLMEKCLGDKHVALPNFDTPVQALAFSPDAATLAIAAQGRLHLWSVESRRFTSSFPGDVQKIDFFPDGDRLVTSGADGIFVMETGSSEKVWGLRGRNLTFDLSPDARQMATGDRNGVTIWRTENWRRGQFLPGATGPVAFAPDGKSLATGGPEGITLWPLGTDGSSVVLEESPPYGFGDHAIHFSKEGRFVLLARNDSPTDRGYTMGVWETQTGKEIAMMPTIEESNLHTGIISAGSPDHERTRLATSSWDHSVKLWDVEKGSLIRTYLGHRGEVWSVALSPDGELIASGSKSGEVKIWPTSQHSKNETIPGFWNPVGFSADSQSLAAYDRSGSFAIFETNTGKMSEKRRAAGIAPPSRRLPAISVAKNLNLMAEARGGGLIAIKDLRTNRETVLQVDHQRIDQLELSPDGHSLVVISQGDRLSWWNLEDPNGPLVADTASHARFSADGSTLVGIAGDGLAIIWDTETRKERLRLRLPVQSRGNRVSLSPDGQLLAATHGYMDYENAITLWETTSGTKIGTLKGHKQGIWSLAFSSDGRTLASSGGGGSIRLWNIATLSELLTIESLGQAVSGILFSPDNQTMVTSSPNFVSKPQIRLFRTSSERRLSPKALQTSK